MARWRPAKGWESEQALPKRSRRWGELVFYKSPKWGYIVKKVPEVPASSKRAIAFWTEWLQWMNILYKYTAPEVLIELKRQEQFFKLPARDVFSSAMNGLLWVIEDENGRRWYSMAHRERISRSLDVFSQTRGAMLARGSEIWEPIAPGSPGEVLVMGEDGFPEWKPGGAVAGRPQDIYPTDGQRSLSGTAPVFQLESVRFPGGGTNWFRFVVWRQLVGNVTIKMLWAGESQTAGNSVWRVTVHAMYTDQAWIQIGQGLFNIYLPGVAGRMYETAFTLTLADHPREIACRILIERLADDPSDVSGMSVYAVAFRVE